MEGPVSFWGYKEQESNLILPEHNDDDGILHSFTMRQHKCNLTSLIGTTVVCTNGPCMLPRLQSSIR